MLGAYGSRLPGARWRMAMRAAGKLLGR